MGSEDAEMSEVEMVVYVGERGETEGWGKVVELVGRSACFTEWVEWRGGGGTVRVILGL